MKTMEKIKLKIIGDERGSLVALESNISVPFEIKRVYYIYGTQNNVSRGFHAHKELRQLAVCVSGSCRLLLDDGKSKKNIILNNPSEGLLIGNLIWREMHDFSSDCVLMVLANEYYDELDYIRDYEKFKEITNNK
jgi:dTDP-4-dehydrorhamnose 3,5-epimerase-like enzyme